MYTLILPLLLHAWGLYSWVRHGVERMPETKAQAGPFNQHPHLLPRAWQCLRGRGG
jgi:hypothetical protein